MTVQTPGLPPHTLRMLLTESEIGEQVKRLANQIAHDYADQSEALLLVGVLKGAVFFLTDLARAIERPLELDFVMISSYGEGTETSGQVRILRDIDADVSGKHVLIVEDILDTGLTLHQSRLAETMRERGAATVRICALLDKPARRRVALTADYRGFEIEDRFVVGYGLDYAGQYRNLRCISEVIHTAQAS